MWTKQPPTETGFYWLYDPQGRDEPEIVEVECPGRWQDDGAPDFAECGNELRSRVDDCEGALWSDKIIRPEAPTP